MNDIWAIRPYRGGDEDAIIALWNESLPQDAISLNFFRNRVLLDPNFQPEGALCALDQSGNIIGFILALFRKTPLEGTDLEPDNGWITVFFVKPEYRGRGVGTQLLERAERFLAENGRRNVFISPYAPNYFYPGLDMLLYERAVEFLKSRGYRVLYSPVAMDMSLVGFQVPADVKELKKKREGEGYSFTQLTTSLVVDLISFASVNFGADWARSIREGLLRGIPYDNFRVAVFHDGEREMVVGFAMYGAYDNVAERFGPFGVQESRRGLGLGKILLYDTLDVMRQNGLHNAWFLWTGENSPAGYLYKKVGFKVTRKFAVMKKEL